MRISSPTKSKEEQKMTEKKLFTDEVQTKNREIVEVNEEYAVVHVNAVKDGEAKEDTLKRVPLTVDALHEKFTEEEIYTLAVRQYFTEQINSLRDNGYCKENRENSQREQMLHSMTPEQIKAMLTEEQLAELFGE